MIKGVQKNFIYFIVATLGVVSILSLYVTQSVFGVATPSVSITDQSALIGDDFSFGVTFDNIGADAGYGPFVDLILPVNGFDGVVSGANDGITFNSATYLGNTLTNYQLIFPDDGAGTGCVEHPLASDNSGNPLQVCGAAEDVLVVLELPFGSFVASQTPAAVSVSASLSDQADPNQTLNITARGGFWLGDTDASDNPLTDPSEVSQASTDSSTWSTQSTVTTELFLLSKTYLCDYLDCEDEIATGPNHVQQYRIDVDLPDGQTFTDFEIEDLLPIDMAYDSFGTASPGGFSVIESPATPGAQVSPDNNLVVQWPSITGTSAAVDASATFNFYIPYTDADTPSAETIDPNTGSSVITTNDAIARGTWTPIDLRDTPGIVTSNLTPVDHSLTERVMAVSKSVSNQNDTDPAGYSPGDTLAYTIDMNLSDFFAIDDLIVTDEFSDGQLINAFIPELEITGNTVSAAADFNALNYTVTHNTPGSGTTEVEFDVGAELALRLGSDDILGGCIPVAGTGLGVTPDCGTYNGGNTRVRITFRTDIQEVYTDSFAPGTPSIDHGDNLTNNVSATANLLNVEDLSTLNTANSDSSSTSVQIVFGGLEKTIYSVNGNTSLPSSLNVGDVVTYRLKYDLPSSDYEELVMTDFLNLPVFNASEVSTVLDTTISAASPAAGIIKFGPDETLFSGEAQEPVITRPGDNRVVLTWPAYTDAGNDSRDIDILLSVTVQDAQYADNFYITNQANVNESGTNTSNEANSIQRIALDTPKLEITKGVVASDKTGADYSPALTGQPVFSDPGSANPRFTPTITSTALAANPINSNIEDVDAGDIVTFAIIVENQGDGQNGAFDIQIEDSIPTGLVIPGTGTNLSVTDGAGVAFTTTNVGGGTGLFDQGIEITDPGTTIAPTGGLDDFDATDGENIIVITYDLEVDSIAEPLATYSNSATITNYAAEEGGDNYATNPNTYSDQSDVTIVDVSADKSVFDTSINNSDTSGNNVSVGEQIQYEYVLTVPEGTMNEVEIDDRLDQGLAFVSFDSITASPGLSTTEGTFADVLSNVTVTSQGGGLHNAGRNANLDFGTITNTDTDDLEDETITIRYTVAVINYVNGGTGVAGDNNNNRALLTWVTDGSDNRSDSQSAANIRTVEPQFDVEKSFSPDTNVDASDTVTVTLSVDSVGSSNQADAYEVTLVDDLSGTEFDYVGSLSQTSGPATATLTEASGVITATWNTLEWDDADLPAVITFEASLKDDVTAATTYNNTATLNWSSMDGDVSVAQSTFNTLSCERSGDNTAPCGGTYNDHTDSVTDGVATRSYTSPVKTIDATSEAFTAVANTAAIGEVVRYRVETPIPEGNYTGVSFRDAIPNGFAFLNDGTATAALVSNNTSNFTSTDMSGVGLNVSGDQTTVGSINPTFVIDSGDISAGPFGSGTPVTFTFGDLDNFDDDTNTEYIVFEYNAVVMNNGATNRGSTHENEVTFVSNGEDRTTASAPEQTVVAPDVAITKTVSTAPVDAGDAIAYSISFTNNNSTNSIVGYDLIFTDTLDSFLTFGSFSTISTPGYATADSTNSSGNNLDIRVDELRPGDTVSFTINATVNSNAPAGYTVPNTGYVSHTTLDGSNGTTVNPTGSATPGASGASNGERVATTNDDGNTTLGVPQIDKLPLTPVTTAAVGGSVTYDILVTLPEGETRDLVVTDSLPAGLAYTAHTVELGTFAGTFENSPPTKNQPLAAIGANGEDFILDFGDIDTTATAGTANNQFTVTVTARVLDVATNTNGTVLNNFGSLSYTDPNTSLTTNVNDPTAVPLTIAEPILALAKNITGQSTNVESGDVLTYVVRTTNTGSSPAFEWSITDTLASHTSYRSLTGCVDNTMAAVTVTVTDNDSSISIDPTTLEGGTIASTDYVECTYTVDVESSVVASTSYDNTADVDWTSGSGTVTGERIYDDGVTGSLQSVDGTQDTDTATYSSTNPGLTKAVNTSTATIGETRQYTLTINSPIGEMNDVVLTDELPAGMIFNNDATYTNITGVAPSIDAPNDGSAATTVAWTFGDITVTTTPMTIRYTATVANTAQANNGEVKENTATLDWEDELNAAQQDTATAQVTLQEPLLTIDKSANVTSQSYGGTVDFTIGIDHTVASLAAAHEVEVTDVLPLGLTIDLDSIVLPIGWSSDLSNAPTVVFNGPSLALAEDVEITYTASIDGPEISAIDDLLSNSATVIWTNLTGAQAGERTGSGGVNDYTATDTVATTVNGVDLTIAKNDGGLFDARPGETITYQIDYDNVGNVTANGVLITETVPADSVFNLAGSTPGWSCFDGAEAGLECTFDVGSVAVGAGSSVAFSIILSDPIADGVTAIENTATITDDGANGPDENESDNITSESTPLEISDLAVVKVDDIDPVFVIHEFQYTVTVTNNGPSDADNVTLSDTMTDNLEVLGVTPEQGVCIVNNLQDVSCDLGTILNGDTVDIVFDVLGASPGLGTNTVVVGSDEHDINSTDNTAVETTFVDPADLVLVKTASDTKVGLGDTVTYTIVITNLGPDLATGTVAVDTMPDNFKIVDVRTDTGTCAITGQDITCDLGNLEANVDTATIEVDAEATEYGTSVNTASVTSNEYDPDLSNNTGIGAEVQVLEELTNTGSPAQLILVAGMVVATITAATIKTRPALQRQD